MAQKKWPKKFGFEQSCGGFVLASPGVTGRISRYDFALYAPESITRGRKRENGFIIGRISSVFASFQPPFILPSAMCKHHFNRGSVSRWFCRLIEFGGKGTPSPPFDLSSGLKFRVLERSAHLISPSQASFPGLLRGGRLRCGEEM